MPEPMKENDLRDDITNVLMKPNQAWRGMKQIPIELLWGLEELVKEAVLAEKSAKDTAYWERNQLVANLARQYESHMVRHPDSDKEWEDDWRWIVCIHTPAGQMTWHIKDEEATSAFGFLPVEPDAEHWDGHTTEEKYNRLLALKSEKENLNNAE